MRILLPLCGILFTLSPLSYAQQGYGFLKLGKTQSPVGNFDSASTGIYGIGSRFKHVSAELAYLGFDNFTVNNNQQSYVELKGGRFSVNAHLDLGWPELTLGASAVYYDADAYHSNILIGTEYDTTYGIGAGLWFPLNHEINFTMNADLTKDILGQDLKHFSIGLQKEFR